MSSNWLGNLVQRLPLTGGRRESMAETPGDPRSQPPGGGWVREGLALLRPPSRVRPISVASARIGCGFRAEPSTNQPHV